MNRSKRAHDGPTEAAELTEDDRHRLLAAERRRIALDVLAERTVPVDLETLAAAVAARETDDPDEPTGDAVERVAVTLHHAHLPRMADYGVIDYDRESGQVR